MSFIERKGGTGSLPARGDAVRADKPPFAAGILELCGLPSRGFRGSARNCVACSVWLIDSNREAVEHHSPGQAQRRPGIAVGEAGHPEGVQHDFVQPLQG